MCLKLSVIAVVLTCGGLVAGQPAATQPASLPLEVERVVRYVPDDACLVVVVPSVEGLAAGLSGFGKATAIPDLAEMTARTLLAEVVDRGAVALNPSGALLLALSPGHDEPVLIASSSVDEGWKTATQPGLLRDDVPLYEFGSEQLLAASASGVVVFARERGELRRALDATGQFAARFQEAAAGALDQRHVVVYADMAGWKDEIERAISLAGQGMSLGMMATGPDVEASLQIWTWLLERLKQTVLDVRVCVGTVRVDARGVLVDGRASFRSDSGVAGYLRQVRRPARDLLRGLPAGETPLVIAYEWEDAPGADGFNTAMAKALLGMESLKQRLGADKLESMVKQSIELNRKLPGSSAVFDFGTEGQGVLYWGIYLTQEGEAVQRGMRKICELTPELMSAWGTFPAAMAPCAAEQVAGVAVDVFEINFETEDSPRQPMVEVLYGERPALLMAPHPEGVAYSFGPRVDARRKLSQLLATDAAPLAKDARVADLFKTLTPGPQLCLLVDIPAAVSSARGLSEQLGVPLPPLEVGRAATPWAGFTVYLEPEAVRMELFVPAAPIKAIAELVEEYEGPAGEAH